MNLLLPDRLHLKRLRESNHTGERMGDIVVPVRTTWEDALIDALDGCHRLQSPVPFRELLCRQDGIRFHPKVRAAINDDRFAWFTIHTLTCELRRMMEHYETSANWLMARGLPFGDGMKHLYDEQLS